MRTAVRRLEGRGLTTVGCRNCGWEGDGDWFGGEVADQIATAAARRHVRKTDHEVTILRTHPYLVFRSSDE